MPILPLNPKTAIIVWLIVNDLKDLTLEKYLSPNTLLFTLESKNNFDVYYS